MTDLVYAISWLYKAIRKGEKLHGLSEVSHLTGLLQVFIYSDLFAAFLRKRFKFALLAGFLLYFLLVHASSLHFLQLVLSSMLAAVILSLVCLLSDNLHSLSAAHRWAHVPPVRPPLRLGSALPRWHSHPALPLCRSLTTRDRGEASYYFKNVHIAPPNPTLHPPSSLRLVASSIAQRLLLQAQLLECARLP